MAPETPEFDLLQQTNHPSCRVVIRCEEDQVNRSYVHFEGRSPTAKQIIAIAHALKEQANELISDLPKELQPIPLEEREKWPKLDSPRHPDFLFRASYDYAGRLMKAEHGWHGQPLPQQRREVIDLLEKAIEFQIAMFPKEPNALYHLATHKHYKGGLYRYCFDFKHSETGEMMVAYRHLWPHEPGYWGRPKDMFHGKNEKGQLRFVSTKDVE